MGISFAQALKRDIDRLSFAKAQRAIVADDAVSRKKKPKKKLTPMQQAVLKTRNPKILVKHAAANLRQVKLTYRKDTSNQVKTYRVAPYSYRYRKVQGRRKLMLFAYDMEDRHIKGFVMRNVLKVEILKNRFKPKWPVELG